LKCRIEHRDFKNINEVENVRILSDIDEILKGFRNDILKVLQDNLVCLLHHGSRAKGEARPDSDYDSIIIVKQVNKEIIKRLQNVFSNP